MFDRLSTSPRSLVLLALVAASGCIAEPPTAPQPPCLRSGVETDPPCPPSGNPIRPIKT